MTTEEKELLLKDLCGRLPYGVKADLTQTNCYDSINKVSEKDIYSFRTRKPLEEDYGQHDYYKVVVTDIKPYLFPLSSMTEEQSMELFKLFTISSVDSIGANYIKINECTGITFFLDKGFNVETHLDKLMDWLNKNHFDYRDLIQKGLAIDATGLNIY